MSNLQRDLFPSQIMDEQRSWQTPNRVTEMELKDGVYNVTYKDGTKASYNTVAKCKAAIKRQVRKRTAANTGASQQKH